MPERQFHLAQALTYRETLRALNINKRVILSRVIEHTNSGDHQDIPRVKPTLIITEIHPAPGNDKIHVLRGHLYISGKKIPVTGDFIDNRLSVLFEGLP